jgi:ribA/ribD-fused uncharacterized protein
MPEQILFWSQGPEEFRFLSNFYPCRIVAPDGVLWKSAEHLFFAMAAANQGDADKISTMHHAWEAKQFSKSMQRIDGWHEKKDGIMLDISRWKFRQNDDLREMLLMTDGFVLVHFAPWGDKYWGVDKDLQGENKQGKILMQVREELKNAN